MLCLYLGLGEGTKLKRVRTLELHGWALVGATVLGLAWPGLVGTSGSSARADGTLEERKLPMRFNWVECKPDCKGWVSAVGIVSGDSPRDFDEFARGRDLAGATVVLDSSGGSVNDAIALGRRFRNLGMLTTVGISLRGDGTRPASVAPEAYCESMCAFLLLSGKIRHVPAAAHVRVHQIWMGDRADDAKASSYTAQDMSIVERDIGRLAKYTFDMGGTGDLLSLSLSVPPWEDLHRLTPAELRLTNLVTTEAVADVLPRDNPVPMVDAKPKALQDRFAATPVNDEPHVQPAKATKTAEAQTGGLVAADKTARPENEAR